MTTRRKTGQDVPRRTSRPQRRKASAPPPKTGRPPKYDPKFCADLVEHGRQGGEIETFPAVLYEKYGLVVTERTVYNWFEQYDALFQAKSIAVNLARKFWGDLTSRGVAGALRRVAKEEYGPNGEVKSREYAPATFGQSFAIFLFKNRFGWKDRIEHSGSIGADDSKGKVLDRLLDDPEHGEAVRRAAEILASKPE